MKELKAYATEDGTIFINKEDAIAHEREYMLKENIEEFVGKHGWSGMSTCDVRDIIVENIEEFKRIINGQKK